MRFSTKGEFMTTSNFSSVTSGWVAVAAGIVGLLGLVFIILFFTKGQPFGTLNDICIGLTAILSVALVWMLYPKYHAQSPLLSQLALVAAMVGALLVIAGSLLSIAGIKGWFLSGLYMAAGNAMLGLWVLGLSYSALRGSSLPHGLIIFGFISGAIMALGLVTIPGIFRGIDTKTYDLTIFNSIWWTASLGYLALYPTWCILLGRILLHG
jgi:hypothetical protein